MSLLDETALGAAADAAILLPPPAPTGPMRTERSAWSAPFRGIAGGAAKLAATAAEFEQAASDALPGAEFRQRRREAMGISLPGVSKVTRQFERGIRPDPETANLAEKMLYGLTSVITEAVPGALIAGPAGAALAIGGAEGTSAAADLPANVDPSTRLKVGLTTGVLSGAGAVLPVVGSTLGRTAGFYLASGPGSFVAQQVAVKSILANADYNDLAKQYDPLDVEGWAMSLVPGAPFAGFRAWQLTRGARGPGAATVPRAGAAQDAAAAPPAGDLPAAQATVAPETIDAAMTHNLALLRDQQDIELAKVMQEQPPAAEAASAGVEQADVAPLSEASQAIDAPAPPQAQARPAPDALPDMGRLAEAFGQARAALDDYTAAGSKGGLAEFLSARGVPAEVNNLVVGLADAAGSPGRMAGFVQQLAREAGQKFKSPADATADAVEGMRALTLEQIAELEQPAVKPSADPLTQSVTDRLTAIEQTQPDMPIRLGDDGNVVTLADEMARVRREAQEGTETELGALDADLLRVAADCALSTAGA